MGVALLFIFSNVSGWHLPLGMAILVPGAISSTLAFMLLLVVGALGLTTSVVIYFSLRLRKLNVLLELQNREISDHNKALVSTNQNLTSERDQIARDLEHSEYFFQSLIESADDAISFHNTDEELEFANSSFFKFLGVTEAGKKSFSLGKFIHPEDIGFLADRSKSLIDNRSYEGMVRLLKNGGGFIEFSVKSVSIHDNNSGLLGYLDIYRDISEQKIVERALTEAKEEAEASNRLKTTFVANISHEIRTPLNSIIGFSNLLRAEDIDTVIKNEYLEQIEYNSDRLMTIIGDIIDLSRLESGQAGIKYGEVDLQELVTEVLAEARRLIVRNEKRIELIASDKMPLNVGLVYTDRHWLKRVLNHLVENAIKFTIEGEVVVEYMVEGDDLCFIVKDSGIGIEKKNLTRIFDEFRQVDMGWKRTFEGLGIGLSLSREVIQMLGGEIKVDSEQGKGSQFTITIPLKVIGPAIRVPSSESIIANINWKGKSCLIVDDNLDVLGYLEKTLEDTGIKVYKASSGKEALEIINDEHKIDVIVLDMQMPGINGIDVVSSIRESGNRVPVIAQTAFIFEDDKKHILDAGCDACLLKPVRKETLLSAIDPLLSGPI